VRTREESGKATCSPSNWPMRVAPSAPLNGIGLMWIAAKAAIIASVSPAFVPS